MIAQELKFNICGGDLGRIRKQMKELGGEQIGPRQRQMNIVYDDPAGSVQVQDARLCLRSGRNYSISYERAISKRGVRQGLVLGTAVASLEQMKKILARIGFQPISRYACYQVSWEIGLSTVSIREFDFGVYFELVGDIQQITRLAQRFGFAVRDSITASYDELYWQSRAPKVEQGRGCTA